MGGKADLICQEGIVERVVDGEVAYVRVERPSSCAKCATRSSCLVLSETGSLIEVHSGPGTLAGQRVELGMRPTAVVTASILVFILPALAFIAGIIAGYLLADNFGWPGQQWIGLVVGIVAFALALLIIRLLTPRLERSGKYEPVITRVLE